MSDTTTATSYSIPQGLMTPGSAYTISVTAIPTGGTLDQGSTGMINVTVPQDQPIDQLEAPETVHPRALPFRKMARRMGSSVR